MNIDPQSVIHHLSTKVGPRPAGSDSEAAAADYLLSVLRQQGYEPHIQEFHYRGWLPGCQARLTVAGGVKEMVGYALPYTFPTPPEGLVGRVVDAGMATIIRDRIACRRLHLVAETGDVCGRVLVEPYSDLRPIPNPRATDSLPTIVLPGAHLSVLEDILAGGREMRLFSSGREFLARGRNIHLGAAEGTPSVLLVSHYDSVFNSPGANDNAGGVAVAMAVFERAAAAGLPVQLLLTAAEELMFRGAEAYLAELENEGRMAEIGACLCIDMVGVGSEMKLRTPTDNLWGELGADLFGENFLHREMASSDHWAFHLAGIASAQLTRQSDPEYHSSADKSDRIEQSVVNESIEACWRLVVEATARLAGACGR